MESTENRSDSDSSWDLDDRCLDDLKHDEDDALPNNCGCLDELKSINSICSGDTEDLLRNLPKKLSASAQSIQLPAHVQHNMDILHENSTHTPPSSSTKNPTVPQLRDIDLSHATSSHASPSHLSTPHVAKQPETPRSKKKSRLVIPKATKQKGSSG
jgi:hypothetical protein